MARSFAITTTATDTLRADAQGHAEAVFTVTNSTSRPIRGMAKVKALGDTKREWLDIEGEAERDFAAGATQQFTVNFNAKPDPSASTGATAAPAAGTPAAGAATGTSSAPPAGGIAPGKYGFRLDVASAMSSDEDFTEGPVVTVEVAAIAPPPKKGFPIWIIPVIAVVLIAIGITLWLLLRTKKVEVPNVVGKTVAEATSEIENKKLQARVSETKVTGTVATGQVSSQAPEAGSKVAEGSMVALVVEGEKPTASPSPSPSAPPTPSPTVAPAAPFAGSWINTNTDTRSNTRIDILQNGTQLNVHAWGKCHPTDCDWGTVDGAVVGNDGIVTWDQGFVLRKMIIRLAGSDRILVITDSVYNDNRPRMHTEETFKRKTRLVFVQLDKSLRAAESIRAIEAVKAEEAKTVKKP